MLARVSDPDGSGVNVHRTYLESGWKAAMATPRKLMPGVIPDGSAVRLAEPDGRLGIAEGIETALAVTRDFGVPCWAALNSTLLAKFICPPGVKEFIVFGDNDAKFGGQAAAYQCAHRNATRRERPELVDVRIPYAIGTDWADRPEAEAA